MQIPSLLKTLAEKAQNMSVANSLYDWRLRGHTPDRFVIRPVDIWQGDAAAGQKMLEGAFVMNEDRLDLRGACWEPIGVDQAWLDHLHSFRWLRDLRAAGNDLAREHARNLVTQWIDRYQTWDKAMWRLDLTGERLAMWIVHYEFFCDGGNEEFEDRFFESVIRQARHLKRALPGDVIGLAQLKGIRGLLYAGLAFEGYELWIEEALTLLKREIERQILADGSHVSRCPEQLLQAVQLLLDIKSALGTAAYPLPEYIQHAIDRTGPALRFFRYGDRNFGLFNGAQESNAALIDAVLAQSPAGSKALNSLPSSGFERVSIGRSLLLFDNGKPAPWPHDKKAHAAPLAFEFSYGRERIFVNCGTHPTNAAWQDALRATAAHNALTIDHRNAGEIGSDGHFTRKIRTNISMREDTKKASLLEASHDGYISINGMTHRRRLFLSDGGHDLRGEDILSSALPHEKPQEIEIRFHIHPKILVSLVKQGEEALLRLPTGTGWRFHQSGGQMTLEDSIYLGSGSTPRKTKQLVITLLTQEENIHIRWALQREGLAK